MKEVAANRFVFIDALRGIAAAAVVFDHVFYYRWLFKSMDRGVLGAVSNAAMFGAHGVQVFFVISGFVIAHSLRKTPAEPKAIGNFILRRQLRLDPPYWSIIFFSIALVFAERLSHARHLDPIPSVTDVLANLFYVNHIIGRPFIVGPGWTLCIEIQFYLVFVILIAAFAGRGRPLSEGPSRPLLAAFVASSLLCWFVTPNPPATTAWFINHWSYFAGGALGYWVFRRQAPQWVAFVPIASLAACSVRWGWGSPAVTGATTLAVVYLVGRSGKLTTWPIASWLLRLGGVSYSLYLVHDPICSLVIRMGFQITGDRPLSAALWYTVAIGCSVIAAWMFFLLVERPSLRFAAKIKRTGIVPVESESPAPVPA